MNRIREWVCRLWGTVRGNPRDAELEEELRLHLELAAEDMLRRNGPTGDAIRAARLRAGGVSQAMEALRDQRGIPWLADLAQDMRHSFRMMRRSPGFAILAWITLALGIGANTAIFSLVHLLIWRDLPVRDPGSLVQFTWQYPGDPPLNFFSTQNYERYRDRNDVFSDLIGTAPVPLDSAGADAEPLNTEWVSTNFFTALGVRPALGRLLDPADAKPGAAPVAVVSWTYWKTRFNLDPAILGTRIAVAGVSAQVVGVTARHFSGLRPGYGTDVWFPASAAPPRSRQAGVFMLMGRLKPGVSIERARAQMRVLDRPRIEELARRDPQWLKVTLDVDAARSGFSTPLHQQFGKPLLMVMAIVGVLLLLTCVSVGSMLLARAAARQREMAVRVSLGAGRFRIARQVLTESMLLAVAGGLLGVVGAYFGANLLVRIMASGTRLIGPPPRLDVTVDVSVLTFTAGAAVLAAVMLGLAPAWTAFATDPAAAMKPAQGSGQPRSLRLFGNGLVVAQVAISLVLLSVAGLCLRHLSNLRNRDLGFDRTSVLLVSVDPAPTGLARAQLNSVLKELMQRFAAIPGVRSVTMSGTTPVSGGAASRFVTVEGFQEAPEARQRVMLNGVAPRYFETYRTPLVAGREFEFSDEAGPRVAIVNQAMVRHYFPDGNAIGKRLHLENDPDPYEIVGIVADAKYIDVRERAPRTVYVHYFQTRMGPHFSLRTGIPPVMVAADVRRDVEDLLKGARVTKVTTLAEQVDGAIVPERLIATLAAYFGFAAALLAAIGLYGLLAYTVARRTSEFGVRVALGATARDITLLVLRNAIALVGTGLIFGAPFAFWSTRLAATMVVNVSPTNIQSMLAAGGVMIAAALLAVYVPVRRATRVDPLVALRSE